MSKKIIQLCAALVLIFAGWVQPALAAPNASDINPVSLLISTDELAQISVSFHENSLQTSGETLKLTARGSILVSSNKSIHLTAVAALLSSLHDLVPVPRFAALRDDPYAQLILKLKDGRQVVVESTSQFPKGAPWNIRVWQGELEKSNLLGSYILLNVDFLAGANEMWQALTGKDFPRKAGADQSASDPTQKTGTLNFYIPKPGDDLTKSAGQASVSGLPAAALEPFLPALKRNPELQDLFNSGFTLFDAAFDLTVNWTELKPLLYSGMLALKAPASRDVIVTTVKIELGRSAAQVTTPLTAQAAQAVIARRQSFETLESLTDFLPGFVFLDDLRAAAQPAGLICTQNPVYGQSDFVIAGLLPELNATQITFYHLPQSKAWAVTAGFERSSANWNDKLVSAVLSRWFPPALHYLIPADLDSLNTSVGLAFRPEVTERKPELIPLLFRGFPDTAAIHIANPQKEGDQSVASLEGELILPENGHAPQMVYCGNPLPDGEGQPYDAASVKRPDPAAARDNLAASAVQGQDGWTALFGLRSGAPEVQSVTFAISQPGYLHVLWSTDQPGLAGVYYAEGRADGMYWIRPQRLGGASQNLKAVSNKNGEIHLLWSAGLDPGGSLHVWRDALGTWQKPEYWAGTGALSTVLLDELGILHLAWTQSDGLDQEFFYSEWSQQTGLSKPVNISRRLGDIGNNQLVLRENALGQIAAVWGHLLNGQPYIDPLAKEVFDQSGIFYAQRYSSGGWSIPEQIGVFAPFSTSLGFEISAKNEPVVVWQSPEGIRSSLLRNGRWTKPALIQKVTPLAARAQVGPDGWRQVKAEIQVIRESSGQLTAVWSSLAKGIFVSRFNGNYWQAPLNLVSAQGLHGLSVQSGAEGVIHALYFDGNNSLVYTKVAGRGKPVSTNLGFGYSGHGSETNQLAVDEAGFVYVMGPPDSQAWKVYLLAGSSQLIPAHQLAPNQTATPTRTPRATPTNPAPRQRLKIVEKRPACTHQRQFTHQLFTR